jgi:DNA modification methylase
VTDIEELKQTAERLFKSRIVGHDEIDPNDLLANPRNWRIHPQNQQEALEGVLIEVGWVDEIKVNVNTNFVVDGHLRVALALRNNEPLVPVMYLDLTEEEELLVLATIDPISALATRDIDKLDELMQIVETQSAGVQRLLDDITPTPINVTEPALEQIWQIGKHRLMCGDSTDGDMVAALLDGNSPNIMVTDPPYGVDYDPLWREKLGTTVERGEYFEGDDVADWSAAWQHFPGNIAYCWYATIKAEEVISGFSGLGFELRAEIVWVKTHYPISRGHYTHQHEPCLYAVRKGAGADWMGGNNETTVWEMSLDEAAVGAHATQKPLECMERPISNHKGDVYEPFSGSGTTIIGAEKQKRTCYAMELEPKFVASTLERVSMYMEVDPELQG